jgi:hypothetical protein
MNTPAKARAPRAIRPPSARDLEFYKLVKIKGKEQWEVAHDHQLHYSRVSQIIKRVTRWLASGGEPSDPLIRDYAARQRLSKATLKLRLARATEIASVALEFNFPVKTTRRRFQGLTEVWRDETSREIPHVNLPALRLLLDATQALQRLEDAPSADDSQPPADDEVLRLVFDLLCGLRARAEANGRLAPAQSARALVAQSLATLLGTDTAEIDRVLPAVIAQNAQEPVPIAQPECPTTQVTCPTAQETLNLSAASGNIVGATPVISSVSLESLSPAAANLHPT